jgi:hypothetical protein
LGGVDSDFGTNITYANKQVEIVDISVIEVHIHSSIFQLLVSLKCLPELHKTPTIVKKSISQKPEGNGRRVFHLVRVKGEHFLART